MSAASSSSTLVYPAPEAGLVQIPTTQIPTTRGAGFTEARAADDLQTVGLAEFGVILRRRWKIIAATTALFTGLGMAYALVSKPNYIASTSILVDPRNRPSFQIEGTAQGAAYDVNIVDSQIQVIQSDTVLSRAIAAEKLTENPEFTRGNGTAAANVLANLKEAVKVKRPDRTYVVEVQVRTKSAEVSARVANAIARAYITDAFDSKSETAQREGSWLDTHLLNLQNRLKEAEARVDAYKTDNKIIGVEGRLIGEQQLTEINRSLVEAQRKASEAKSLLDQVEELRKSGRLPDTTNEALKSGVIERLRGQLSEVLRLEANARSTLGPRHPAAAEVREQIVETRRQINEELTRIAEGARSSYALARSNLTALEKQLDFLKRDTTGTNQRLLRLRELERAVDAQKAVFEKFLRDKEQIARLSVDTPAGRIIAPASLPTAAAFPSPKLIGLMAAVAGIFAGVGLALVVETLAPGQQPWRFPGRSGLAPLRERLARRFRPRSGQPGEGAEIEARKAFQPDVAPDAQPGLRPLAILPRPVAGPATRWLKGRGAPPAAQPVLLDAPRQAPGSDYARQIMALADRLTAMVDDAESVTILVSSLGGGGESAVLSANLGHALAASGRAVLLIDGIGGPQSLTARIGNAGEPVEVELSGQRVVAVRTSRTSDLLFLPLGGAAAGRTARQRMRCPIVLIDGPAFGSPELDRIDIARHIDGVIALAPASIDPEGAAVAAKLEARFGSALMGIVGQAA